MLWEIISGFVAWVILVPLLLVIKNKTPKHAFWLAYFYGFIFFLTTIYWIYHVTIFGLILLVAYLAIYFGIFGFLVHLWGQSPSGTVPNLALFVIPALWVSLEYIRAHLFTGFGWALLGYSQYLNLPIIQIADITGAYGVSFLIVMANVAIAKRSLRSLAMTLVIIALSLGYGYYKLNHQPEGYKIRASVVQGNIPQDEKWDDVHKEGILKRYISLTEEAALDKPDLIIWPETSSPGFINADKGLQESVSDLAKTAGKPILVGAPTIDETGEYRNSAVMFSEKGDVIKQYDKLHLVPYGEFIPFEKELPFFRKLIVTGDFVAGNEWTIFSLVQGQAQLTTHFGVLICFEDIFSDLVRGFVRRGANFMVNITNDAWFKKTQAPYQHAQASVFRAVENRVSVVRSANTGLSCFISPTGRIISRVQDKNGEDIFVSGHRTEDMAISSYGRTFYTRHGDIFVWLCAIYILVVILKEGRGHGRET